MRTDWEEMAEELGVELTEEQRFAIRTLIASGQRFLVHFGFDNAVEKADEVLRAGRVQ